MTETAKTNAAAGMPAAEELNTAKFVTVALAEPIVRGDQRYDKIVLRKPAAGEMRGLHLQDIMQSDVGAMITIATRISDPILTEPEVSAMDPADFLELAGGIIGFFMSRAQKEAVNAMAARAQGKME